MRLYSVGNFEYHLFGLFPADTRIGNGLSVDVLVYLLVAVLDVALYHEALYKLADTVVVIAAAENFLDDTWLFEVLLA